MTREEEVQLGMFALDVLKEVGDWETDGAGEEYLESQRQQIIKDAFDRIRIALNPKHHEE